MSCWVFTRFSVVKKTHNPVGKIAKKKNSLKECTVLCQKYTPTDFYIGDLEVGLSRDLENLSYIAKVPLILGSHLSKIFCISRSGSTVGKIAKKPSEGVRFC